MRETTGDERDTGLDVDWENGAMFSKSAQFYDAVYGFKDYVAETEKLRELIEARVGRGSGGVLTGRSTLLDVACGTGKHLDLLQRHFAAEGLDLDAELLRVARERVPGTVLHQGDMTNFDLGRRFDAVVCLFSSIGYVRTEARLRQAVACMARHVTPGGVLVVEPWFEPETWQVGRPHALLVNEPALKLCRMNVSAVDPREPAVSVLDFQYLVATPEGVQHFNERHELGLFTREQYQEAFEIAGMRAEHDAEGLMGRGLYVATVNT